MGTFPRVSGLVVGGLGVLLACPPAQQPPAQHAESAQRAQEPGIQRQMPPDSSQAVQIAIDAVDSGLRQTDRTELKVVSYRHEASGFFIVLAPKAIIAGGGGRVWIANDGSVTKVERGQ
jgi:hypothetical protein